jgi:hypothetical protein
LEGKADLHTHSRASDGTQPASRNVQLAKEAGLAAVGITDHDTVAGIDEALAEGGKLHIQVVPGIEISSVADEQDIHVLGYFIDYRQPLFLARLEQLRGVRERRNEMMMERLRELGMNVSMEEVVAELGRPLQDDESVGRPHIAALLVRKGYVGSVQEAFDRYLARGKAAYVNPPRIHPREAIEWIHDAGGTAVLAHPGLYCNDSLVLELIQAGLDGIEAYHSDHSPGDESRYESLARKHHLIVTAGSDFHGERNGHIFHAPIGSRTVSVAVIEALQKRRM